MAGNINIEMGQLSLTECTIIPIENKKYSKSKTHLAVKILLRKGGLVFVFNSTNYFKNLFSTNWPIY